MYINSQTQSTIPAAVLCNLHNFKVSGYWSDHEGCKCSLPLSDLAMILKTTDKYITTPLALYNYWQLAGSPGLL